MGILKTLFGGSDSRTDAATLEKFGGIFDQGGEGKEIADFLKGKGEARFDQGIDPFVIPESTPTFDFNNLIGDSAIGSRYQDELLNPTFGTSQAEQALLDEVISQFQGNTAMRNLNATGGGFAQTIAPTLAKFRQDRLNNLSGGFNAELQAILGGRGQDIGERGADIAATTQTRGQDILGEASIFDQGSNLLLALADLSRPTPIVRGGASSGSSQGGIIPGISGFFKSDRRLKKNIIKLGEYIKGINLYSFEYLWGQKKHIGFMADEVKKIIPEAVVTGTDGFDSVYYDKVVKYG
jgi:hypothetical protein